MMRPSPKAEHIEEIARALICERLLWDGYGRGTDPVWLARLLVAQHTLSALLERLQRQ